MKQEMAGRFIAMFAGVLLATVTSVYANHTAIGQGTYAVDVDPPVSAEFHFVVAKQGPDRKLTPGLNFVQSAIEQKSGAMSFQTVMISTAIAFTIPREESAERTVTIVGEMVATTFLDVGSERQTFAELVRFTAIGTDKQSATDPDFFFLEVKYSASQEQGPLLASLGFADCKHGTCTMTLQGPVKTGDIFVHTASGG